MPSWFVRVTAFKADLLAANAQTHWVPRAVKARGSFPASMMFPIDWHKSPVLAVHVDP